MNAALSEEELLAIAAALGAYMGLGFHIVQIRLVNSDIWAQNGRQDELLYQYRMTTSRMGGLPGVRGTSICPFLKGSSGNPSLYWLSAAG